jgi:hypothetical protein
MYQRTDSFFEQLVPERCSKCTRNASEIEWLLVIYEFPCSKFSPQTGHRDWWFIVLLSLSTNCPSKVGHDCFVLHSFLFLVPPISPGICCRLQFEVWPRPACLNAAWYSASSVLTFTIFPHCLCSAPRRVATVYRLQTSCVAWLVLFVLDYHAWTSECWFVLQYECPVTTGDFMIVSEIREF